MVGRNKFEATDKTSEINEFRRQKKDQNIYEGKRVESCVIKTTCKEN